MALGRWGEVGVLAVARMSMGAQLQVVGALGPLLIGTLAADWAALGSLIGAYSLAGIFVALPAGMLLARFGDRPVLLAGVGLPSVLAASSSRSHRTSPSPSSAASSPASAARS